MSPRLDGSDQRALINSLRAQIAGLEKVALRAMTVANTGTATSAKRFRIGVFVTPLTVLGGTVSGTVNWSAPMTDSAGTPVDVYNVDAACSAFSTSMNPTYSGQSSTGVTVTFTAPVLLAAGSVVVVQAIGPVSAPLSMGKA